MISCAHKTKLGFLLLICLVSVLLLVQPQEFNRDRGKFPPPPNTNLFPGARKVQLTQERHPGRRRNEEQRRGRVTVGSSAICFHWLLLFLKTFQLDSETQCSQSSFPSWNNSQPYGTEGKLELIRHIRRERRKWRSRKKRSPFYSISFSHSLFPTI